MYIIIGAKIFICYSLTCCKTHVFFTRCLFYFFCKQYNKRDQLILIFTLKMPDLTETERGQLLGFLKVALQKRAYTRRLVFLEQQ